MMSSRNQVRGPVAIGGVGGSGTRIVASIIMRLGFYMGKHLNHAKDNLWFSLLIRRPSLVNSADKTEVFKALSIFERAMTGRLRPQRDDLSFIVRAVFDGLFHKNFLYGLYPQYYLIRPALTMMFCNRVDLSDYIGWGWKEPNTHLILDKLAEYFGDLKYIHVLRHGLDIAYGKSKGQLELFGDFFGIPMPNSPHLRPKAMLQYWIKANERAVRIGEQMLDDRFLLLNWDDLCIWPQRGLERILDFLGVVCDRDRVIELSNMIKRPKSIGRYRKHDITIFSREEIEAVRKFGFEVADA
jgi:hypothetical protein